MITVTQGMDAPVDLPVSIHFGEMLPDPKPAVYFSHRLWQPHCHLWCFFHRRDWSSTGGLIGRLDSHEFDYEGALQIIPNDPDRPYGWVTVYHNELRFYRSFSNIINIDSQGHGVTISSKLPKGKSFRRLEFSVTDAINMDDPKFMAWLCGDVQRVFNEHGVKLPWQWNDWRIRRKCGAESDGDIWNPPMGLLKNAIKVRKIRRKDWEDLLEAPQ